MSSAETPTSPLAVISWGFKLCRIQCDTPEWIRKSNNPWPPSELLLDDNIRCQMGMELDFSSWPQEINQSLLITVQSQNILCWNLNCSSQISPYSIILSLEIRVELFCQLLLLLLLFLLVVIFCLFLFWQKQGIFITQWAEKISCLDKPNLM